MSPRRKPAAPPEVPQKVDGQVSWLVLRAATSPLRDPDDHEQEWWVVQPEQGRGLVRRLPGKGDRLPLDHPVVPLLGPLLGVSYELPNTMLRRELSPSAREEQERDRRSRAPVLVEKRHPECLRCGWVGGEYLMPAPVPASALDGEGMDYQEKQAHIRWAQRVAAAAATGRRNADAARVLAGQHHCPAGVHGDPVELPVDGQAQRYYGLDGDVVAVSATGARVSAVYR